MADFESGDSNNIMTQTGGSADWEVVIARDVERGFNDKTNDDPYGKSYWILNIGATR